MIKNSKDKKSSDGTLEAIGAAIFLIALGMFVGYVVGDLHGYDRWYKADQKQKCLSENSYKPFNEVEAKCIKYFTEEQE